MLRMLFYTSVVLYSVQCIPIFFKFWVFCKQVKPVNGPKFRPNLTHNSCDIVPLKILTIYRGEKMALVLLVFALYFTVVLCWFKQDDKQKSENLLIPRAVYSLTSYIYSQGCTRTSTIHIPVWIANRAVYVNVCQHGIRLVRVHNTVCVSQN